jgi:protoporphyrinogen oxidase
MKSEKSGATIAVVGAGIMGLVCAYELLRKGFQVRVFEKSSRIGGMSESFDFDGLTIEKFYHFICIPDKFLINLLHELDCKDKLKWKFTKMGFFYGGKLYNWGNPLALFWFKPLDFVSKLRYGIHVFWSIKRKRWDKLDRLDALSWIEKSIGKKASRVLWSSLFELKFYHFKEKLSAAWIWSRLKRIGLSRKYILFEKLGYIQGGSEVLLSALTKKIINMGGVISLNSPVDEILIKNKRVTGLRISNQEFNFSTVITTIPLPYIPKIAPQLPKHVLKQYLAVENIGVICVILKLKHSISKNFWLNINDKSIEIPGIIEYSNLNTMDNKIVYFPFYLSKIHQNYSMPNDFFIKRVHEYCKKLNQNFKKDWVLAEDVHRYEYAQPVCQPKYLKQLPPEQTIIKGLLITDTSYYYPEDRSISESIRSGKRMADLCDRNN